MVVISIVALASVLIAHTNPQLLRAQVPARGAIDVPTVLPLITNLGGSLLLIGGAGRGPAGGGRRGAPPPPPAPAPPPPPPARPPPAPRVAKDNPRHPP